MALTLITGISLPVPIYKNGPSPSQSTLDWMSFRISTKIIIMIIMVYLVLQICSNSSYVLRLLSIAHCLMRVWLLSSACVCSWLWPWMPNRSVVWTTCMIEASRTKSQTWRSSVRTRFVTLSPTAWWIWCFTAHWHLRLPVVMRPPRGWPALISWSAAFVNWHGMQSVVCTTGHTEPPRICCLRMPSALAWVAQPDSSRK